MATIVNQAYLNFIQPDFENTSTQIALIRQDGTEVPTAGTGYTRKSIGTLTASSDTTHYILSNSTSIDFPVATSDWAPNSNPVVKIAIYQNTTLIATTDLPAPLTILQGDQVKISAGMLKIKVPKQV